jgi:hypothetical protein
MVVFPKRQSSKMTRSDKRVSMTSPKLFPRVRPHSNKFLYTYRHFKVSSKTIFNSSGYCSSTNDDVEENNNKKTEAVYFVTKSSSSMLRGRGTGYGLRI